MTKAIITVLALLAVAGIVAVYLSRDTDVTITEDQSAQVNLRSYNSEAFGYSLSYPDIFEMRQYGPDNVVIGQILGESIEGVVEARVLTLTDVADGDIYTEVQDQLVLLCAAYGPSTSLSCTGVEDEQTFRTTAGTEGRQLTLRGVVEQLDTNDTSTFTKGPYFIIPLSATSEAMRVLVIHPPLNQMSDESDADMIRQVALSVMVRELTDDELVMLHVRDNISTISPHPEVLGGTFHVTEIEAQNGMGVVQYEDGHVLFVADFTYSISEDKEVSIETFEVRED